MAVLMGAFVWMYQSTTIWYPTLLANLKQQPGKDIIIDGSATLVQSLMGTDLIDEYRFLVQPFIMGRGRRFFPDGTPPTKLRLVESKALSSGSLALVYQPVEE